MYGDVSGMNNDERGVDRDENELIRDEICMNRYSSVGLTLSSLSI